MENDIDKPEEKLSERAKLVFEKALEQRKFEISNFWSRGWFFGAFMVLLATGFIKLLNENFQYCIYLAFLGLLVSIFQALMNRGSKYWQERWENKTKNAEAALGIDVTLTKNFGGIERYYLDAGILAKNENGLVKGRRFSVSKLTILIWDIVAITWAFAWFKSWNFRLGGWNDIRHDVLLYHTAVIGYILLFFFAKSWLSFRRKGHTQNGGWLFGFSGGKVFEKMAHDKEFKEGPVNIRNPYYHDSEAYYNNRINELNADEKDISSQ